MCTFLSEKPSFLVSGTTSQAVFPKEPIIWRREKQGQKKSGNPQTVLKKLFPKNLSHTELLSKAAYFICIILNNKKIIKNKCESNFEFY